MKVDQNQAVDPGLATTQPARRWAWVAAVAVLTLAGWVHGNGQGPGGGVGTPAGSVANLAAAASGGNVEAQLQLGKLSFQGRAGAKPRDAARWLQAASEQGSVEATAWLGACYLLGRGVTRDAQKARSLLETAAQKGSATGQRYLGVMYEQSQDYSTAAGLYAQAAQQGDSNALVRLARLNAHGWGGAKDKKKADSLLLTAAAQGGEWAQLRLGRIYERGDRKAGVAKNPGLAIQLYTQAAGQGNRIAAYRLGQRYSSGVDSTLTADPKKALQYYKQAALSGYAPAQYELGRMREIGQGVKGSPVAAYYWYSMAQRQGHEQAGERLLNLRSTMTTEEVNKAEDLLRQHDAGQRNATQQ